MNDNFLGVLSCFIGKNCWGYTGPSTGPGHDSWFSLFIGSRMSRPLPLSNDNLMEEFRLNSPEYRLFVAGAVWAIFENDILIADDRSSNSIPGDIYAALEKLKGTSIIVCTTVESRPNLRLMFSNGLILCIGLPSKKTFAYSIYNYEKKRATVSGGGLVELFD